MINDNIYRKGRALRYKSGQTLAEYALVLALISVVAIGVLMAMGTQVKGVFSTVNSQMALAGNGGGSSGSPGSPPAPPPPVPSD